MSKAFNKMTKPELLDFIKNMQSEVIPKLTEDAIELDICNDGMELVNTLRECMQISKVTAEAQVIKFEVIPGQELMSTDKVELYFNGKLVESDLIADIDNDEE